MEARYLTDLEWRICHAVNIYVFRNGRDGEQPVLVHIPPSKKKNMRTLMNVIQERVKYPVGYAKFLYKMDGTRVKDPCELEMYNNYVVASNFDKHFKCAAYGRKRSPLLVLNRESKHVRVLKLQNQNYYEWLLKKKAVGEERPPYIYPAMYTNENYRPQDLPLGHMGNFNPPEVQAPGCCYPRTEGNRTYRVDGHNNYVVNTVTVDVTPDLADKSDIPRDKRKQRHGNGQSYPPKHLGKILEPTPSDMINANVLISDGASQAGMSVGTSETEERVKITRKIRSSKHHKKTKSHRVHVVTSEEYHEKQSVNVLESSSQSTVDIRVQPKSSRRSKPQCKPQENCIPPPPAQFRDNEDIRNNNYNNQQPLPLPAPQGMGIIGQHPEGQYHKQELLQVVDRALQDPNGPDPKTFYYFPEKLAEINSSGNIQQFELLSHPQQPGAGQWAMIQQHPQQQILQPIYTLESQPTGRATLMPAAGMDSSTSMTPQPSQVLGPFPSVPQNMQIQAMQNPMPLLHTIAAAHQPIFHQQNGHPTQCVVIPNNSTLTAQSQQHLRPPMPANVNFAPATQLVAVQNPNASNSHLQQVYQLGIVQQPNPQTCIQIDAKAMRQYVDNQKMMELRYQQMNSNNNNNNDFAMGHHNVNPHGERKQGHKSKNGQESSDQTESELDIPYTPLKTYRMNQDISSSSKSRRTNPFGNHKTLNYDNSQERSGNPSRHHNERLPLTKVKSRNVAIQMGHPGASEKSYRAHNYFDHLTGSDISFIKERRGSLFFNPNEQSNLSLVARTPRSGHRESCERFLTPSKDRTLRRANNFCSSFSDHFLNIHNSPRDTVPTSIRSSRRFAKVSDPVIDDLVTIPPPTEFRENQAMQFTRRAAQRLLQSTNNNNTYLPQSNINNVQPYANNERSESTSQYMFNSQYP